MAKVVNKNIARNAAADSTKKRIRRKVTYYIMETDQATGERTVVETSRSYNDAKKMYNLVMRLKKLPKEQLVIVRSVEMQYDPDEVEAE